MPPLSPAEPSEPAPAVTPRRRRSWVSWVFGLALAVALVPVAARLTARLDGRIDLLTHFQVASAAYALLVATLAWWVRRWMALVALLLAVVQIVPLAPYYGPNPRPPAPGSFARLRIVSANVLVDNRDYEAVEHFLMLENPDIIGLIEYTPAWQDRLSWMACRYPHRIEAPDGYQGLALWSRVPLRDARLESHLPGGWPCVHAEVKFNGRWLQLWLVHPSPPILRTRERGFPELSGLAARVDFERGPRLVIGDVNTTSGSPYFADFLRESGLRDTRLGFGIQGSWPSGSPYRIAIDHAFASDELAVADRRLGPDIGSDHRPLVLDLAPASDWRAARTTSTEPQP